MIKVFPDILLGTFIINNYTSHTLDCIHHLLLSRTIFQKTSLVNVPDVYTQVKFMVEQWQYRNVGLVDNNFTSSQVVGVVDP